ncbi:MAG TPA: GYDIA family GHMP kinase [Bacteroidales bacterium]|nr:GYDIA family GHMP kinase [Bacteroidales bacterium]HSA44638.1 GYDIA family GHMP kinase [Bacteroidales bacterium]
MTEPVKYKANGKLLISGEYLVLHGALSFALPLRFGQQMQLSPSAGPVIRWTSSDPHGTWYRAEFNLPGPVKANPGREDMFILRLLEAAGRLNPAFAAGLQGTGVSVDANYPVQWGLGSSSTLIYLVACWADVNPFRLFTMVSKGSGYDLACAGRSNPLLFSHKGDEIMIRDITPGKGIREHALFAWLGNKQSTDTEIDLFLETANPAPTDLALMDLLTLKIATADTADELQEQVLRHESLLARILQREPLSARLEDFPGAVKSLGAWGGDFAMFVTRQPKETILPWFREKEIYPVFTFDEIIASK